MTATNARPSYASGSFAYSLTETVRTATSVPSPTTTRTYAPPATALTSLLGNISYTTWGKWDPNATIKATDTLDPYGSAAWTSLWQFASPPNFTEVGLYSTTVTPNPVPTSELILPPQDYFGPKDCYDFPADFILGVAGSAAQIEGATAEEGKSPSLADLIIQNSAPKGYVANENYYLYKQDLERLASMGVKYYSFSIAWTRILPFAVPGTPVNQEGLQHYSDLIDFVLLKGMIPVVTLVHADTPIQFYAANLSTINDAPPIGYFNGGFQNETFVDAFVNYAQIVMTHYADRVPLWITFNEPLLVAVNGASVSNVLQAHSQVYHWYKETLGGAGNITFKSSGLFGVPQDASNTADVYAADYYNSFQLATFGNPIFLGLDYPDSFKQLVPDYDHLTTDDLAFINGTSDYFAVDPYTAYYISPPIPDSIDSITNCTVHTPGPYAPYWCVNQSTTNIYGWDIGYGSDSYVYITPKYLRLTLSYLYDTFHSPILITEFGFPVFGEAEKVLPDQLYVLPRSIYFLSFMSEILKSIWEDGVDVAGALAWSFADNWEFGSYDTHFGLQTVNRTTQERMYKKSFFDLVDFVKTRTKTQ